MLCAAEQGLAEKLQVRIVVTAMKRRRPDTMERLQSATGWKKVAVDDALFVGADTGGFVGLEELGPAPVITSDQQAAARPAKKSKKARPSAGKGSAVQQHSEPEHQADGDSAKAGTSQHALKAAAKKQKASKAPTQGITRSPGTADIQPATSTLPHVHQQPAQAHKKPAKGSAKRKQSREPMQHPQPESEPAAGAQPSAAEDLEAIEKGWDFCGLHPGLLATLAAKGFWSPTPIQQRCLPSAVWSQKDIIGAAQTVRRLVCSLSHLQAFWPGCVAGPSIGVVVLIRLLVLCPSTSLPCTDGHGIPLLQPLNRHMLMHGCMAGLRQDTGLWAASAAPHPAAEGEG